MPPWEAVREVMLQTLLLPFDVAAVLLYAVSRVSPRYGVVVGGFVGIVLAFMAANDFRSVSEYRLDNEKKLTVHDIAVAGYDTVMGNVNEAAPNPRPLYWLPWAGLLAGVASLVTRLPQLPKIVSAVGVVLVACVIARWLVPPTFREAHSWAAPTMALTVLLLWASLEAAAKARPGGAVPFAIAGAFLAASAVILHTHSARLSDFAMIAAGSWLGLAAVAWQRKLDLSAIVPFAAAMLPGLLFIARQYQDESNKVSLTSFLLVALSPVAFAPALLMSVLGKPSPRLVLAGAVVLGVACTIAVVLAAMAEKLHFDE